ncbi:PHD-type domain-containing protein [Caenorhabditis elegans]|nr:PHD-type domain-containing protein [Caenorhabditis elegans]CCD73812.1 PHD-type domain-containing protein [Caenorhabditis elegans]|eukprot:NP_871639.1 PHd Finger family [Caenorhabditis elegans]
MNNAGKTARNRRKADSKPKKSSNEMDLKDPEQVSIEIEGVKIAETRAPEKKETKKSRKILHHAAEIYTKKLYRQVATGFDMDGDSDSDIPGCSNQAMISDNWKPEYSGGTQELAHPDELPQTIVNDDDFWLKPKDFFSTPKKRIVCNRNSVDFDENIHEEVTTRDALHYEITAHDMAFLQKINMERKLLTGDTYLPMATFIRIIKELETEAFKQIHNHLLDSLHVVYCRPPEDGGEDAECDVCRISDCDVADEMVFCDMCNTCVHMVCAGIEELPDPAEPWKCAKCAHMGTPCPPCVLCPALGGSMTYSADKTQWAHHSCALFIPEIIFENEELRAPMTSFERVAEERWSQMCSVCDTRQGACVTCSWVDCEETYHVCCALRAGMTVRIQEVPNDPEHNVTRVTYCHKHTHPQDVIIEDKYRTYRNPWLAKMETVFFLMTDYEMIAERLQMEEIIVSDVYEYWKQRRMSRGTSLIPHLHDHVLIEPVIHRVARKVGENLDAAMKTAGISTGSCPSTTTNTNGAQFFRPAALMVTEFRQYNLKRAAESIQRDLQMFSMLQRREQLKKEQISAENRQFHVAWQLLQRGLAPGAVLEAMKISKSEIRKFTSESAKNSMFSVLAEPSLKRKHPGISHIPHMEHQKSPLRPRNAPAHHGASNGGRAPREDERSPSARGAQNIEVMGVSKRITKKPARISTNWPIE